MIKNTKIRINGKSYKLKAQSYRAMFLFEEIVDKPITEIKTLHDQIAYIYCILKTSNEGFEYNLEEFIDILEEGEGNILKEFAKIVSTKK